MVNCGCNNRSCSGRTGSVPNRNDYWTSVSDSGTLWRAGVVFILSDGFWHFLFGKHIAATVILLNSTITEM